MMVCFEKEGKGNTARALGLAVEGAKKHGIRHLVIASSKGETLDHLKGAEGLNIVVVTTAYGYPEPGANQLPDEKRAWMLEQGYQVCTAAHALSGAERSMSAKFSGIYPTEIIAHTLRMFGSGIKVCVEIAAMAADAGMIPLDEPVIAVGGTKRGADAAVILLAATTKDILDTKVEAVICKPANLQNKSSQV